MAPKSKPKASPKVKAKRLDRNVTARNSLDAIKSSDDYRKLLADPERSPEAAELIRRHAIEADPNKPGYEANEVLAPLVRAFTQLPVARRTALLEMAGNPELFANLPNGYDPLEAPSASDNATLLEEKIASLVQPADTAQVGVTLDDLARSPATFAGHEFASNKKPDQRAAIDRTIPGLPVDPVTGMQSDPETGKLPPLTPEHEKARQKTITEIVGVPMWQQVQAAMDPKKGLTPVLPAVENPTLASVTALENRLSNPRGLLAGAGSKQHFQDEIERISALPVDQEMEPFSHVPSKSVFLSPEAMNEMKINALIERSQMLPPEERVFEPALRSIIAGEPFDLSSADPRVQSVIAMSHMKGGDSLHNFSDAPPTAVPNAEVRDNMVTRLRENLAELNRRQAAFAANPAEPAIRQREKITPITVGTLGLQEPYQAKRGRGSMTVDRQLDRSARSESDRIIEAIYRASLVDSSEPMTGDVSDFGRDDILRQTDIRQRPGSGGLANTINLDALVPQWRYQYPVRNAAGEFEYPALAPSASFLADQMIGWHGIENADDFRRTAIPVLERSIAEQYQMLPQTKRAMQAAMTRLVPGTGPGSKGQKFFTAPGVEDFMEGMLDSRYPITQFNPKNFSQDARGGLEMPHEPLPDSDLDDILNEPSGSMQQEFDLNDLLRQPPEGDELSRTMNRNRSGLLQGLYA